ncbi:MAG: tetratricopeptide repeat protein [Tannerellaceae bacterium]|jgi:signal transduction histidine kinase|nr:tetratricopeptide repeat protein [Tannerellaceae bacterium]
MKQIITFLLFFMPALSVNGQSRDIDSLLNVLETQETTNAVKLDLYEKITAYYSRNDLEKGIEYALKGLQLAEKGKESKMTSLFNKYLGIVYYYKSSFDTSQMYLDKALALAIASKDEPSQMAAYGSLGNLYRLKQDYRQALEYYMKALSFHEVPVTPVVASLLNNVGVIHRILNDTDRSISFLEQGLEVSEQLNDEEQKMAAIYGLANAYADKENYAKAVEYYQRVLEISRKTGNKPYEIMSINSLATCFSINKEFDKALAFAEEGLIISEEYGGPRHITGALGTLADIYREMGDYKRCEEISLKAWAMDSTSVEDASYTAYTLSVANIYLGKKEDAEYFLNKYYEIMKKGNEKSLHESMASMEVKYETEKKEIRIASLEKERQLYVWLGLAGVMLMLSLAVALWLKIRNSQKEKRLVASNAVQEGEMGERERIAGELHDRLLGTLSAVKSEIDNTDIGNKLNGCIEEVRRISRNLMPLPLRNGMKTSLEDFTAQFLNVRFHFFGQEKRVEKRLEFVVYCCANELVTNSIRHSGAKNINVQLVQGENHIALTVQDDGCGFDEKTVTKGVGLKSIQDRVVSCKGKLNIFSYPGKGTETVIEINI